MDSGTFLIQHIQHMSTSTATDYEGQTLKHQLHSRDNTNSGPDPNPSSISLKKRVKQGINQDVALEIIEPVPVGTPITWCSGMVIALKKDGSPRCMVDLQELNAATMRET